MLAEIAGVLGISGADIVDAQWVDNGPGWVAVRLASAEAVLALNPARSHPHTLDLGVVGACPAGDEAAFEIRAFFTDPYGALVEDPVCGSLNASVAQWLIASGGARAPYVVSQGGRLDRKGRIFIDQDDADDVWVGGATATLFSGVCEAAA
jgi:PhzF family phenazine biosynthesis protein